MADDTKNIGPEAKKPGEAPQEKKAEPVKDTPPTPEQPAPGAPQAPVVEAAPKAQPAPTVENQPDEKVAPAPKVLDFSATKNKAPAKEETAPEKKPVKEQAAEKAKRGRPAKADKAAPAEKPKQPRDKMSQSKKAPGKEAPIPPKPEAAPKDAKAPEQEQPAAPRDATRSAEPEQIVYINLSELHPIEGRILRNGGKDLPILCKVYTGMTVEQEALLFAEQNGFSAPLTAGIKLRAKVVGGDAPSKAFLAATNRVGLAFNYDSLQLSDYRISCVGTALKLYNQMGEKIYCESLRLIVAAWDGKPDSFRASVLRGVMHFVELYHGKFSEERLIRALGSVHPMEIYRVGRDNPAKLPGWKKYVFPIYMAYNGKGRKDALPMKF